MLPSRCSQPPCRNWLVTRVSVSTLRTPRAQAAVRSAGTTPQAVMNASSASSPPLAWRPSSRRRRRGRRRPGRSSRPASDGSGSRPAAGSPGGDRSGCGGRLGGRGRAARRGGRGDGDGACRDGLQTVWWTAVLLSIQMSVAGASSTPGRRRSPRMSPQPAAPPASRYCSLYVAVGLVDRHDPGVRLVVGVEPAGPPSSRGRRRPASTRGPGGAARRRERRRPSRRPCPRRTAPARRRSATNMSPSMYMRVHLGRPRAVASQPLDPRPGSRRRRPPASRPGSAARTGRRRTGCRGSRASSRRYVPIAVMSSPHGSRR